MVSFIVSRCRLVSSVKISFSHIFTIWNSSSVIVFVSSLGHLSGPVLLTDILFNLLAGELLLLGETPPRTWCSGEHGESAPCTWEPGVERVKGACKGEEGLVVGKAADFNTQRSLLLH